MDRFDIKFMNYSSALGQLRDGAVFHGSTGNDLTRDGVIQRFEIAFELAWKTIKALLEDEGLDGLNSPKAVLKEAYGNRLITEESLWLDMLADRNSTTHIYDEEMAKLISERITTSYIDEFTALLNRIAQRRSKI